MTDATELANQAEWRLLAGTILTGYLPSGLDADMFAREAHRAVFVACQTIVADGRTLDPTAAMEQLAHDGTLDVAGGAGRFFEVFVTSGATVLPHEVDRMAVEVADWSWRRRLFTAGRNLMVSSGDLSQDPRGLLADIEQLDAPVRAGLTVHSGHDITALPDPTWLVDGHLQDGMGVLFGPWSAGKSFVAVDVAVAVASGQRWWGHPVVQGPVLYLAAEGAAGLARRLEACAAARDTSLDGLHLVGDPINLGRRSEVADLDAAVRATGARLLVVDTWGRVTAGADENDNGQAGRAVEALDRIRSRRGCTVLVLHHSRKGDSTDPRGAGSLPAAADSMWNVTKTAAGKVHVASAKQKDGQDFQGLTFALRQQGRSATLELLAAGKPRAQQDLDLSEALEQVRRGLVLKALIRSQYDDAMVDRLCAHPDVREVLDDQERPCVTAKEMPL